MSLDKMLQMKDLMEVFGVSRATIYEWVKKEGFPKSYKIGGKNFWKRSEIEAYLESTRKE
jgi:predicted DNA-binding transcriptional regulator AlpA